MMNVLYAQSEWALLVLRLALGLIFIAHGWRKLHNLKGTVSWIAGEGFKPGWLWGGLITAAELIGGICILLGVFVQPVALILTITMMAAFIWNLKKGNGFFQHLELDIVLIAALLMLATLGEGIYSLARYFGFGL